MSIIVAVTVALLLLLAVAALFRRVRRGDARRIAGLIAGIPPTPPRWYAWLRGGG